VAEGGGLLNRYRIKSSIGGSNPPLSATSSSKTVQGNSRKYPKPQETLGFLLVCYLSAYSGVQPKPALRVGTFVGIFHLKVWVH
jgi:hypothetical protein